MKIDVLLRRVAFQAVVGKYMTEARRSLIIQKPDLANYLCNEWSCHSRHPDRPAVETQRWIADRRYKPVHGFHLNEEQSVSFAASFAVTLAINAATTIHQIL